MILLILEKKGEKGNAPSRAKAYAIRVSANIALAPVNIWTRIEKENMIVPPTRPPESRKICAAGRPVGEVRTVLRSEMQKHRVTVNIHPTAAEIVTAQRIACGPIIAASCVSSDMCVVPS